MNKECKTKLPPYKVEHVVAAFSEVKGWGIQQMNVPDTWEKTQGEDVTVLVIDTGYADHIDLENNMIKEQSRSFIPYEQDIVDFNGHGVHCCGVIAAEHNGIGMVGVAPKAKIITAKALDRNGSGSMKALEDSLEYAIQIKPDIVSMSLGAPSSTRKIHNLIKELYAMNIPVICASGNSGRSNDVNYPAKYPETIAVTAFDKRGRPARFNSTGPQVDFAGPGVDIYSTWINNTYSSISGTSMACPFIAGIVALMISKHRKNLAKGIDSDCQTIEQIKEHLIKYSNRNGIVGRDDTWGYGIVDVPKLIRALKHEDFVDWSEEAPLLPKVELPSLFERIINWFRSKIGI